MAQACARLCHQRRHLLNDDGGNGESGKSGENKPQLRLKLSSALLCLVIFSVKIHVKLSHDSLFAVKIFIDFSEN